MQYAFDLDGTLAHTKPAVLAAYREVGVEPPDDFFGKPWRAWLKDEKKHAEKNKVYARIAPSLIEPTRMMKLYNQVGGIIITGASREAAYTVLRACHAIVRSMVYAELDVFGKVRVLNAFNEPGIVFEDSISIANQLAKDTKWTVCHVLS